MSIFFNSLITQKWKLVPHRKCVLSHLREYIFVCEKHYFFIKYRLCTKQHIIFSSTTCIMMSSECTNLQPYIVRYLSLKSYRNIYLWRLWVALRSRWKCNLHYYAFSTNDIYQELMEWMLPILFKSCIKYLLTTNDLNRWLYDVVSTIIRIYGGYLKTNSGS